MNPLTLLFGVFVVLLLLGAPTYLALLAGALSYFFFHPEISAMMIMQKMFGSLDNFVLLAVPMFMLSGSLMNSGGITDRIFGFAKDMVGHYRGGLGHVNVVSSFIFAGMSGSALADVGGLGQVEIAAMKAENYDDDLTLGITAASATLGPIVPPSIPMVVYGAVANVSVGALFLAGFLPGFVMLIVLCGWIVVIAHKRGYPKHKKTSWKERFKSFRHAFFALLMPFVVMGGLWSGYFTPTEASLMSIVYVLFILIVIYRDIDLKTVARTFVDTAKGFVPALGIISASSLFGWVLQFEHLDRILINAMFGVTENKVVILLMLNLLLLFCGCILDATPVIMLFVPLFLPLADAIGVHQVQMGVIVVLNLMIGLMTPPIGQSLFVMSSVMGLSFEYVVKNTCKWLVPLFIALLMVTFIPELTLFLPRLFGLIK
jgi:tripartite ATP-independent transporter DctM subunit